MKTSPGVIAALLCLGGLVVGPALGEPGYADRTDAVEAKMRQLQEAYAGGRIDVALSLAESMRWTLEYEKQARAPEAPPQLPADAVFAVDRLPAAWATWAAGWAFCRAVTLAETAGIDRAAEPVDLTITFAAGQVANPWREVRVARVDRGSGALQEVASQVYGEVRVGDTRYAHLVFLADVAANGETTYLVLHGNPNAECPEYPTDLDVAGEGWDLDIGNRHFTASLSSQTGQLERVVYKRLHGLELYAGGKGHGEPPTIDWSNDYVDEGHFQKLRIRSWPEVPDYEVVRGPLCAKVRRWGFPVSPVHPVYAPSRMLVDQTYTFYAGADWFLKDGVMEALEDLKIAAMRDDEWVLSGYSFTDRVWIDAEGHLHEGAVPADQADDLWGVGFYHRDSRDAFIALWLEHWADGLEEIHHNGAPTLHYYHHGQLWSRYPAGGGDRLLPKGTAIHDRNAYLVFPYPDEDAAGVIETVRRRFLSPLQSRPSGPPAADGLEPAGALARRGETPETAPLKPAIWEAMQKVVDEQLYKVDANVVDLGYVYDVRLRGEVAEVLVTMPHRGRPLYQFIESQGGGRVTEGIRERLLALDGIRQVVVRHTWNPPWTTARMTDTGRRLFGLAP